MSSTKTVFIGSLYALNSVGVDQLVERIRSNYPDDPASAPFVAYDYDKNLLSCSLDRNDNGTPQFLLAQYKLFTDHERKNPQVIDPAIRPLEGALVRTEIDYSNTNYAIPGLLDVGVDDLGAADPLEALDHCTTYWRPQDGDIKILTTAIAERIASLTGCSIFPEPLESRVRLVGGDFNAALRKLENLESLLALQYQQREFTTVKTNGNVLLKTTDNANPVMEFERINNPDHSAYRRIIVEQGPQVLQGKCLGELRISGVPKEESIPSNLMLTDISETNTIGRCGVWDKFMYETLGDEDNKNPRKQSEMKINAQSSPSSKVGVNEFIDTAKAARVAAWSGQVDKNVDPNKVAPEFPEQPSTRRRRIAVDSDEENEDGPDQATQMKEPAKLQVPGSDAQAPRSEVNRPNQPSQEFILGSMALSDLLKDEESEHAAKIVPDVTIQEVGPLSLAEPDVVASSRRRLVKTDSDSDLSDTARRALDKIQVSLPTSPQSVQPTKPSTPHHITEDSFITPKSIADMTMNPRDDQGGTVNASDDQNQSPSSSVQRSLGTWAAFDGTASKLAHSPEIQATAASSAQKSLDSYVPALIWPPKRFDPNAYGGAKRHSRNSSWKSSDGNPSSVCRSTSPAKGVKDESQSSATMASNAPTLTPAYASPEKSPNTPTIESTVSPRGFDPQSYGARTRPCRGPQTIQATSKSASRGTSSKVLPGSGQVATTLTQGSNSIGNPGPRRRGTRHRGRGVYQKAAAAATEASEITQVKQNCELIDISDSEPSSREPSPPPGFDFCPPMSPMREQTPLQYPHLLDEPMENEMKALEPQAKVPKSQMRNSEPWMQVPETRLHVPEPSTYIPVPRTSNSDLISFSSGSKHPLTSTLSSNLALVPASNAALEESASYVNKVAYKGPNIAYLKSASLAKLHALKEAADAKKATTQAAKSIGAKSRSRQGSQSRPTMTHQAGNPGKKGSQKHESKAEKKKRTEQALREAYGKPSPVKSQQSTSQETPNVSKKRTEIPQPSPKMIIANSAELQVESRGKASEQLVSGLGPIFEASKAFSGEVQFQFQLGQLLISYDSDIRGKPITAKKWDKLFGQLAKVPILSAFTSALTTNGADIDRALEVRAFRGGKLWDATSPGPHSVFYEFECQSKHGKEFLIVLDQSGNFELRSSNIVTIGMVGLHTPAQVWDACAVLFGVENWTAPAEVEATVGAFVRSIHVLPNRHELALVFRQPEDNEIMVKNVQMRRVSHHHCLLMGHEDYQLQVTEVKSLYTKVHPEDKKLWQAYEKSHIDMMQDGLVHYQISIVDKEVNEVLASNQTIELGELADPTTGKALLKVERIKQMVDLTAQMVSKIDWMGSRNNGTLARAAAALETQRIRQQQSLPPMARSKIVPLMMASRIDPSRFGGAMSTMGGGSEVLVGRTHLPGTRSGTLAEIYEDQYGLFAKGYGGARVPIAGLGALGSISEVPLEPDDSASQMGGVSRKPGLGALGAGSVAGGGRRRRFKEFHGDKGPGYW